MAGTFSFYCGRGGGGRDFLHNWGEEEGEEEKNEHE